MAQKAILFDLDGTLTDSGEGIINCASLALRHFGLSVPSREEMRVFVGPPLDHSFRCFGVPADKTDEAIAVYRSRYTTVGKFENFPYPGIRQLLEKLKNDGHRLFVATSKPEGLSVEILTKFELAEFFELICGATLDSSRSKKADVIAYLLEKIGGADNAVMVGDTAFDVIGAKAHGIDTIGVAWGYGAVADMVDAGAAAIADSPEALYDMLSK
ncbi:MAG: HAD-IA family hydrolase [Oscillospiraceae bacterium]|nr:HAD-IA family hydrolase [Oscillospiraceae bacterium]